MLTSSFIFLNAMMDAARWLSARKLRSSFSYRTSNFRKRLNQLCATSTTQRLLLGITLEFTCLLSSSFDMRYVAMFFDHFQCRRSGVASIGAQVLVSPVGRVGSWENDGFEHRLQLRYIMAVGSCHDERQRDAISVHQQMALAPIFSPDPLGWVRRFVEPVALSSSPRQYFAIARRYLQIRRTRQDPTAIEPQRPRLSPTPEIAHELRWHCRIVQRATPSTGSQFAAHRRCLQKRAEDLWVCVRRQPCGRRVDPQLSDALESAARHDSRNHQ